MAMPVKTHGHNETEASGAGRALETLTDVVAAVPAMALFEPGLDHRTISRKVRARRGLTASVL